MDSAGRDSGELDVVVPGHNTLPASVCLSAGPDESWSHLTSLLLPRSEQSHHLAQEMVSYNEFSLLVDMLFVSLPK